MDDEPEGIGPAELHHYRVTAFDLPETGEESRLRSFDLDGDGYTDNTLGSAYATLHSQYTSFEVETGGAARLGSPEIDWVLTILDGERGAGAALSVQSRVNGIVQVPERVDLVPAVGDAFGPELELRGGEAPVPLGLISDALGDAAVGWALGSEAVLGVDAWDAVGATVTLGVGLWDQEVRDIIYPNLAAYFTTKLDDPDADFAQLLDADTNGVVTPEEIAAERWITDFFEPDLGGSRVSIGLRLAAEAL
jgi:hypothetical protein